MGAWGEGPYDNDSAADWFYGLSDIGLFDFIEKGLNSEDDSEVRAAAWLVEQLAVSAYVYETDKLDKHRELAVEKLQAFLDDPSWIGNWRDEKAIVESLTQQIHNIENPDSSPGLMEKIATELSK